MTKRCETMTLEDVKAGICLCSKLLSKVMPSMKTSDKEALSRENDQRKDLEGSSEQEMNEWNVIEFSDAANHDNRADKSIESSQDVFVSDAVQEEVAKNEAGVEVEEAVEEIEGVVTQENEIDSDDKSETTPEDLEEWSDFKTIDEHGNTRTSEFESESSSELIVADGEVKNGDKSEVENWKESSATTKTHTQPFQSSLIQACVKFFQVFFAKFVVERVLKHLDTLNSCGADPRGIRNKKCYTALRACGIISDGMWKEIDHAKGGTIEKVAKGGCGTSNLRARRHFMGASILVSSFRIMKSSKNCAEAFVAACKLLLELSCFPVCSGKDPEAGKVDTDGGIGS